MEITNDDTTNNEVNFEEPNGSDIENLLRTIVKGYEEAFNKANDKYETTFGLTITTHKVPTKDGNKDVAYLRLDRTNRSKGEVPTRAGVEMKEPSVLIVQQMYMFKNLQERLNPAAPWKDQLYMQCLAYLISGGLEYAEFLRRAKMVEDNAMVAAKDKQREEEYKADDEAARMSKMNLIKADTYTEDLADQKYKEWLASERKKEGL